MAIIDVTVERDYLTVDTADWLDAIGDRDDNLTHSLRDWLDARDGDDYAPCCTSANYGSQPYHQPLTEHMTKWAAFTFRCEVRDADSLLNDYAHGCRGLYGEGNPVEMHLYNGGDNLLSSDFGAVWFYAPDGTLLFVTTAGSYGTWELPEVYRVKVSDEYLFDYSRAYGGCSNGHTWDTDDGGITMYQDGNAAGTSVRIDEQIRQTPSTNYVACPECGKAVRFEILLSD